jgi:predicted phosphoribosyltransferase
LEVSAVLRGQKIFEDPSLHDRTSVFSDRHDAGRKLALLIKQVIQDYDQIMVCAIPAGGVPVGAEVALALGVPFGLAIVRKVRIPGNPEAGFGAVTWDGDVVINDRLVKALGLTKTQIDNAIAKTKHNVIERVKKFTGGRPFPDVSGKMIIVTDDGLASGFTMLAAARGFSALHPAGITVAVPTASASAVNLVAASVDRIICANIRTGPVFAVADAYRNWYDLEDVEVLQELKRVPVS